MSIAAFLKKKSVSIWGFGYLGYTFALKMQENGFKVSLFDFDPQRFEDFENGTYPGDQRKNHWSLRGSIPDLNKESLRVCLTPESMFGEGVVHLIAMPILDKGKAKGVNLEALAKIFIKNFSEDLLVLFQSVGKPGQIDEGFCKPLSAGGVRCPVGTAFRGDWVLEEFQNNSQCQVVSGSDAEALQQAIDFFGLLKVSCSTLGSIKEAEVFENAKNALNYTITALVNQLALGYPDVNFQRITKLLLQQVDLSTCQLSIGAGGYRMPFSVDALIAGSAMPECLSILKEAEAVNFSTILCYSDYFIRQNFKAVLILGITNRENQKDLIAISPSLTLSETMNNRGLKIYVNDPHYRTEDLKQLMPFCEPVDLQSLPPDLDAIIVMSAHMPYRSLSQEQLDAILHPNIKLIVDNTGIFANYRFQHAEYHQVGDGKINILKT